MSNPFKSKQERDAHLVLMSEADESSEEEYDRLFAEYFERLPVLQFSVCPHCAAPYHHTYDPFGSSGLFWGVMPNRVDTNCEHACLIRSAYICTTAVEPPYYSHARISLGPELPYVIRRILELNTMKAVISKLGFDSGDILYPIVYFATEPQDEFGLTADWDNEEYKACDVPSDPWDFDLRPWVESGQVGWCLQGNQGLVLADAAAESCPFYGLKGHIGKQFISPKGNYRQGTPWRNKPPEGWDA